MGKAIGVFIVLTFMVAIGTLCGLLVARAGGSPAVIAASASAGTFLVLYVMGLAVED